jgi:invasion protein IalB
VWWLQNDGNEKVTLKFLVCVQDDCKQTMQLAQTTLQYFKNLI